jgi:diguanylate cyclase (GGDEF)-like protein/PAS domain S-box-containing protein
MEWGDAEPLRSEELVGLVGETEGDVIAFCTPARILRFVSPASRAMFGWEPAELVGHVLDDFVHPDDLVTVRALHSAASQMPRVCVATYRFRCRDGGYLWTESVLRQTQDPRQAGEILLRAAIRDIADRKLVEARLERQATTDPLTGIANRTVFMDRLEQALRRMQRHNSVLAVVYLDLDRFKVINDSLGHELGDRLLMKVAERALGIVRPADTLARIGGDEFVVLAEDLASVDEARHIAERLCESIEAPFDLDGEAIVCTASAGVAMTSDPEHSALGLLEEADLALYRAKNRGRNRTEVFDQELRATAIGRLQVEQMIRSAINEDRLRVQYQPIVELPAGHIVRVEALVRIQDENEVVGPERFLSVAEETGLLTKVDEFVLAQAIEQAATWTRATTSAAFQGIAINVTARRLSDSKFVQVVADALEEHDLPPGSLAIEVTERVLMEASNSAMECLRTIRALGVPVGLDDFGTGYSSLAYLRQFPLDFLKIDQSFVRQLGQSPESVAIATAIIDLAHALHLSVIAEGVETDEQLQTLIGLGCDQAQGFLFGRADDPSAIDALVRRRSSILETST